MTPYNIAATAVVIAIIILQLRIYFLDTQSTTISFVVAFTPLSVGNSYLLHHRHPYETKLLLSLQQQQQQDEEDEEQHSVDIIHATTTNDILNTNDNDYYDVIEYSILFHRHAVIRYYYYYDDDDSTTTTTTTTMSTTGNSSNCTNTIYDTHQRYNSNISSYKLLLLESFLYIDDAIRKYPHAIIQSVPTVTATTTSITTTTTTTATTPPRLSQQQVEGEPTRYNDHNDHIHMITSGNIQSLYPLSHYCNSSSSSNNHNKNYIVSCSNNSSNVNEYEGLYYVFQSILHWTKEQVDQYIQRYPYLLSFIASSSSSSYDHNNNYYVQVLYDKLRFLTNPIPPSNILLQINTTDDIDWLVLFYQYQYGAGLSIEQITIALQQLPDPLLLLRTTYHPTDFYVVDDITLNRIDEYRTKQFMYLYEQTPAAVVQITITTLHLYVMGVSQYDIISLSYLHWMGRWDYCSCRIVLHAFRSSLLYHNNNNNIYKSKHTIDGRCDALLYLQSQLQIRPWHINSMCKVHPRLLSYTKRKVQQNIEYLHQDLQLTTYNIQRIVLQMPSIVGTSIETVQLRKHFWMNQIGLTVDQLRTIITHKPALLQYSLHANLEIKLQFFTNELGLDNSTICHITNKHPEVWGRSMTTHYHPVTNMICTMCDNMTTQEYGQCIIQNVPEILLYNYQSLYDKLEYIKNRLGLDSHELKVMILSSPRILKQSIDTSLRPKIDSVEEHITVHSITNESVRNVVRKSPSLLTLSKVALQQRLQRSVGTTTSTVPLTDLLVESAKNRRTSKVVWLMSTALMESNSTTSNDLQSSPHIELEFADVVAAALHAETSVSNMYKILRLGRTINGRRYVYATTNELSSVPVEEVSKISNHQVATLANNSIALQAPYSVLGTELDTANLCIYTAGRAFPPEDTVRGRKRSGGMALQVRQWSGKEWSNTCSQLWKGLRLRLLPDSSTLIIGYPYTRPSRPRCSLYACREAIRVAKEWTLQQNASNLNIAIACESNYVLNLLQNTTRVYEWGKANSISDFTFDGPGELYKANPDILYPLCRMYYLLIERTAILSDQQQKRNITINFVASDLCDYSKRLRDGAKLAATLMYDSVR